MSLINPEIHSVTAFAPATSANLAVGFDILGLAFDELGDKVTLSKRADQRLVIETIEAKEELPLELDKNTATVAIQALCSDLGLDLGFSIELQKGIPLSSGMGGSAASAVAALFALNAFLKKPLSYSELAGYALLGEETASGQKHADNIAPCLFGGLTLIKNLEPLEVLQLPLPEVFCVLVHPHIQVSTKEARKVLKKTLPLAVYIKQSAHLAAFIASLYLKDLKLLQESFSDLLIEPQRAGFIPDFYQLKQAALAAGALGFTLSGSGPSLLALSKNSLEAKAIALALQDQLKMNKINSDYWLAPVSKTGARILRIN